MINLSASALQFQFRANLKQEEVHLKVQKKYLEQYLVLIQ